MNGDSHDSTFPGGDDLFDLPSESSGASDADFARYPAPDVHVDVPSSALPKRPQSSSPAGPPLGNVDSTPAAILEQTRPRPAKPSVPAPEPAAAAPAEKRRTRLPRKLWIAFGALAVVNGLVLGFLVIQKGASTKHDPAPVDGPARTTVASVVPIGWDPAASAAETVSNGSHAESGEGDHARTPPSPETESRPAPHETRSNPELPETSALELARSGLKSSREDLAAGRISAARTRLGRLGLAIDAIDPTRREDIRAEIALLLAQSLQDEADEAARTKR